MNKAQFKLLPKFLKLLLPYRKRQIIILILSGLSMLVGLINPYLSKLVVDKAILGRQLNTFIILGIIGVGVFILNGLINVMVSFLRRGMQLKVNFDLNKKVFTHIQSLPLDYFRNKSTGEHMFRINYDVESVVGFITSIPEELVNIFPQLFLILGIIFYLDWQMAVFSLVLAPILYLPVYYLTRRMRKVLEELLSTSQNIFKRLEEVFSHIYLVKAFRKEKTEVRSYLKALIKKIRIDLKNIRLEIISGFAGGSLHRIVIGLITLFGGYQVIRGRISAGTLTAIMLYLTKLVGLQNNIAFFMQRIAFGLVSCKRLDEILTERSFVQKVAGSKQRKIIFSQPRIEFKEVSFGYQPNEYILRKLGFNIEKGMVSLVGSSGCGKTTVLNLILGLYKPWAGEIFIEGNNIKELDSSVISEQVGVALQEPFLWNDSIENNIGYGKEKASIREIIEVARLTGVDEFVRDLPFGYNTIIGEDACKISEGQKQKVAIARALLKKPKILILDEAMSSMDSLSEEKIITQIKTLEIPTVIIVSHRLSTVMACDLVYFFKENNKLIIGRPQQLLEQDEAFYNLFGAQASRPLQSPYLI